MDLRDYWRKVWVDDLIILDESSDEFAWVAMRVTPEEWAAWHDATYPINPVKSDAFWLGDPEPFDWTALDVGY